MVAIGKIFEEIKLKQVRFRADPNNNQEYFSRVIGFLKGHLKLRLDCYRESYVRRRIEALMNRLNIKTYMEFNDWLISPLFDKEFFVKHFTINVTEFFRDISPFRYLESTILPRLAQDKLQKGEKTINIWSAGCSSGEEPYSIAIILDWFLKQEGLDNKISIQVVGTDLDKEALDEATKGIYVKHQLRNISEQSLQRNFDLIFGDKYGVKPLLKSYVKFQRHDILSGENPGKFDIIFCRNVLIYIEKEKQVGVLECFWHALNVPGYLILGKTEVFPIFCKDLYKYESLSEHAYIKN